MKKLFTIITLLFAFVSASLATILYPKAPKADLLDIRFNVDGTATDVSGKNRKIVSSQPRPSVAFNDKYNLNAATFTGTGKDFYFFDYSADKKFIEEISGDFTMECLMRIDILSKQHTPFCSTNGSGFGFDISWISKNCLSFVIHDGSKYVAVTDKSMAEGKYYHAVGVVRPNKDISFYVNGELIGTAPFKTIKLPSGRSQRLYVGCDVNGNGDPEYAFKGEIVVARMYSKALTNEEVKSVYKAISSGNKSSSNNPSTGNNSGNTGGNNKSTTSTTSTSTNSVSNAPANLTAYRDKVGQRFTFLVKAKKDGKIWGGKDKIYTDESDLATASYHSDIQNAGNVDKVVVEIVADQGSYPSLTQNGITSNKYGKAKGAFKIIGIPTTEVTDPDMSKYRSKKNEMVKIRVTGRASGTIYGKNTGNGYSDNSDLATAAVHAGFLKPGQTGTLFVRIKGPEDSHEAVLSNDVQSRKYGKSGGTFKIFRSRDTTPINNSPSGNNGSSNKNSGNNNSGNNNSGNTSTTTSSSYIIPDGYYVIRYAEKPEYVLTVTNYGIGKDVVVCEWENKESQIWKVENQKNGSVVIRAIHQDPRILNIADNKIRNNTKTILSAIERLWVPERQGNGTIVLMLKENKNYCLDLMDGLSNAKNNGIVEIWYTHKGAQEQWKFERVGDLPSSNNSSTGNNATILHPTQTLKADLLDIRFNVDGTATDVSGKNRTIVSSQPRPSVALNDKYNLNAATFTGTGKDFYFFDYSADKKFIEEISGDFTMECLMRIDILSKQHTPFCSTNGSGFGFDISWISKNCLSFVIHDGSKYVAVTDKSMAEGKYYHAVGVVRPNKDISFYVNGELIGTAPFKTIKLPSGRSQRLYVGCDVNGNGDPEYAFKGEIVVARMYSKALTNEEVKSVYKAISSGNNSSSNNSSGNSGGSTTTTTSTTSTSTSVTNAPANLTAYRGKVGQRFTFLVKAKKDGKIWGGKNNIYTDDSDLATASCHSGAQVAGNVDKVVVEIVADQGSYPSLTQNGITSNKYGAWKGAYKIIGVPTTKVTDPDMSKYRSKNGEMVIVRVTGRTSGTVYGQNASYGYMDKSDLATAAVHAGLLKPGETGTLYVRIKSGSEKYEAVLKNGVQSRSYGKSEGNFKIRKCTDITSANGTNITGNSGNTGNSGGTTSTSGNNTGGNNTSTTSVPNAPSHMLSYRGQNGKVYTFKVTGSTSGRIWGGENNIYTDDSYIATAAVHAGLVKAGQTGTIKVKILPGQSSYSSIERNGVTSYKNNGYGGSYQLSK